MHRSGRRIEPEQRVAPADAGQITVAAATVMDPESLIKGDIRKL